MVTIAVIGEGMVELSRSGEHGGIAGWETHHGGDALNSAIHLARFGLETGFISALGADPLSRALRRSWAEEGLDLTHLLTHPDRNAGLYAIETDAEGERSFAYWRSDSAARAMLDLPEAEAALAHAARCDLLYLSLISLAILPPAGRERLAGLCRDVRAHGGRVAFDSNFRPRLWSSPAEARAAVEAIGPLVDIALPTQVDEAALFGPEPIDAVADRWVGWGVAEVAVKSGADGCLVATRDGRHRIAPPRAVVAVDSSGAGDAFNAGYLAARLAGRAPAQAAPAGHELAAWTILRRGAIPPRDHEAPYRF
ncbi:2-keto-3-deoxygluconate kinase [Rhizorhabdus wittichii RW1]|uniref:2-keto-3-deoxygluconate kinase n=1 Tax=Rhizorhabdus wittichii (strain DSM 6014 / CCUG 31198 / JCM 15750 / NBRC 105917 / EY 4224 / RW1) TaxID=392499 RepID=A0A9J9HAZ6_RHIWR|nr:2-keto-3-deoxygluconate kinase [Rhizorhabdus wittichii RW1]